jgi:hypothetical protein
VGRELVVHLSHNYFGSPVEIISGFGSKEKYLQEVKELETELYKIAG